MATKYLQIRQVDTQREVDQECTLDDVRVIIRVRYSAATDRWYASIYNTANELLVGSLACVPGVDLLRPYKHLAIPRGQLFCSSKEREPPTFTTLDTSVRVLYREA
jgi:hypothetical protein